MGVYAPLTARDNVVVDDVLVLWLAKIDSQATGHWAFDPVSLLWSHSLRSATDAANSDDGPAIHWFADHLYLVAEVVMQNKFLDSWGL